MLLSAHLAAPSPALGGLCAPPERQGLLPGPSSRVRRGRGSTRSPMCRVAKPHRSHLAHGVWAWLAQLGSILSSPSASSAFLLRN